MRPVSRVPLVCRGPGVLRFGTVPAPGPVPAPVPVPLPVMSLGAVFAGMLPNPPLTVDQVRLLAVDNVVGYEAKGLGDLGITATPVAAILPEYMGCYRPGGQFARR